MEAIILSGSRSPEGQTARAAGALRQGLADTYQWYLENMDRARR